MGWFDIGRIGELARWVGSGFAELAWPTRCVCCDMPGALLCDACRESLPMIDLDSSCDRCGAPYGTVLCTECWSADGFIEHPFSKAVCAMEFTALSSRLIVSYKDRGEKGLAAILARILADAIASALDIEGFDCLAYIPATTEALRKRGFDHMELIAQEASRLLELECVPLLEANDRSDQRALGKGERAENMQGAFSCVQSQGELPKSVLLIDDVMTTCATLDAAGAELLDAGVEHLEVATIYRVW